MPGETSFLSESTMNQWSYRVCLIAFFCLGAFGCQATSKTTPQRGMMALSEADRVQKAQDDLDLLRRYDAGLRHSLLYARSRPELFVKSKGDEPMSLSPDQGRELRTIWRGILDYMRAIDGIKRYWKDYKSINVATKPNDHARAFFVGYAAWMVQYQHGLDFVDLTVPSALHEVLLDEASPEYDIPKGAFKDLKLNIINVASVSRFMGGAGYYKVHKKRIKNQVCTTTKDCLWAMGMVNAYHEDSKAQLAERAPAHFSYNAYDIVRDLSFKAWFPLQKNVAEWMGDTKVKRKKKHLIKPAQLAQMRKSMLPGDIVVARHNWYLSNVGLPGFWPHAELYLGSPKELAAHLDTPEVTAAMPELQGQTFTKYLSERFPREWVSYNQLQDGKPHRIIEAISEGVVFSSLEKGAGADYIGVMRPRYTKVDTARAIIKAMTYIGRPYDFNFDFLSEETIVCTELVYKAWQPSALKKGPDFSLVEVMGRATLPANDVVRQYAQQLKLPDSTRQLDFVYFLDGREKKGKAVIATAKDFALSWERPKWDVVQK